MTGLLSWSEVQKISFIDLVHAHEVLEFKMMNTGMMMSMIGEAIGG